MTLPLLLAASCEQPESPALFLMSVPYELTSQGWEIASWSPFRVSDSVKGFAYGRIAGKDVYIAVSYSGKIAYSYDGDIWESAAVGTWEDDDTDPYTPDVWVPSPDKAQYNAVVFGKGQFIAVGKDGKYARSYDGVEWSPSSGPDGFGTEDIQGIAYGAGYFVIVGANGNISYSTNGVNWTQCKDKDHPDFSGYLNDIAYSEENNTFYVVGEYGTTGYANNLSQSNWHYSFGTATDTTAFHTNPINKVAVGTYKGNIGIAVVFNEWSGKRIAIATQADDFSGWDNDIDASAFGNNTIQDIAYGGGKFVAAGASSMIGYLSTAHLDEDRYRYWQALVFQKFHWWEISALAALNGRFFVGDVGGKIGYSR